MQILHLTLKKCWFDMIASGKKREEYRELKPYWDKRLLNRTYDAVLFRNGYRRDAPEMMFELKGIEMGFGEMEWGAPEWKGVYILKLGKRLDA
jgi:hypothetical protein